MSIQNKKCVREIWLLARMAFFSLVAIFVFLSVSLNGEESITAAQKERVIVQLSKLPMQFESNQGQTDASVNYLARGLGYSLYFTPNDIVMLFKSSPQEKEHTCSSVIKFQFIGANSDLVIKGVEEQENKTNYFIGNDPKNWHVNIPLYAKVVYQDLYPGIDAIFYGNQGQLEYDLKLSPGSDPKNIRLHIDGTQELLIDADGNLCVLSADGQEIYMKKPFIYQEIEGKQISVNGQFTLLASSEVGFDVGLYDISKPLVIDPILSYSTYLGGSSNKSISYSIAVDSGGNAYITGYTLANNFPTEGTPSPYQGTLKGSEDAFITKLNPAGSGLIYSTYLGGSSGRSRGLSIAIDALGNAYITGFTEANNFPITSVAFQNNLKGSQDAFITKLNPSGSDLVYSTYLGGDVTDIGNSIAVDAFGNAYITGDTTSANFPKTTGAYQPILKGLEDAFITKLNSAGSSLVYSTYLGGFSFDSSQSIAVDAGGNAYITGTTTSSDFPITADAYQTTLTGFNNAFITKLNPAGSDLIYSTYLGGTSYDTGRSIAVDAFGSAYVAGQTFSTNFPTTPGAFQKVFSGVSDAFITKLNPAGSDLVYSTYLGGTTSDSGQSIAVDAFGNAYITGSTTSNNFPITTDAYQATFQGFNDAFITKLNPVGSDLVYSTYLGGISSDSGQSIAVDAFGNAYITGDTASINFPTTADAFQKERAGGSSNAFIAKFMFEPPVFPPINAAGVQKKNCFLTQTEYRNIITWQAPLQGNAPVLYRIYRDSALSELIVTVSSEAPLIYIEHNCIKNKTYTYYIVSVDAFNNSSLAASVTVN